MSAHCPEEERSHHHDKHRSKGVIADLEVVLVAITKYGQVGKDGKLTSTAFLPAKRYSGNDGSIARKSFTPELEFFKNVAQPIIDRGEEFLGVAQATAGAVRTIDLLSPDKKKRCQAFCVIDSVSEKDYDGHGIVKFCEDVGKLTTNQQSLGFIRRTALEEMAVRFSHMTSLQEAYAT